MVPGVQLIATEHDGLYHVAALRHLTGQTELLLYRPRQDSTGQERRGGGGSEGKGYKRRAGREERRKGYKKEKIAVSMGRGSHKPQWRSPAIKCKMIKRCRQKKIGWRTKKIIISFLIIVNKVLSRLLNPGYENNRR